MQTVDAKHETVLELLPQGVEVVYRHLEIKATQMEPSEAFQNHSHSKRYIKLIRNIKTPMLLKFDHENVQNCFRQVHA